VSLRYQLKDTSVQVQELVPPYVQTELMGKEQATDPPAMPLAEYVDEVMTILTQEPGAKEILVKRVYPLRFAGNSNPEKFYEFFEQFNAAMAGH
jgi:uncharacterized oxidoreductase